MTARTRATCRNALNARLVALLDDLHDNADYYAKGRDWRTSVHRSSAARELLELRAALRELQFIEWAKRPHFREVA